MTSNIQGTSSTYLSMYSPILGTNQPQSCLIYKIRHVQDGILHTLLHVFLSKSQLASVPQRFTSFTSGTD